MDELIADVWKILKELGQAQKRTEKVMARTKAEITESQKKTEEAQQRVAEAQKETERVMALTKKEVAEAQKKTERVQQETKEALKELSKNLDKASGNFNNKWGRFLEGFVRGNLLALLRERGIPVERVQPRFEIPPKHGQMAGDFDLLAINGREIVAVEVKTTLTKEKLYKFLAHLKKFKEYFPEYNDRVIYGGVAYMDDLDNAGEEVMAE